MATTTTAPATLDTSRVPRGTVTASLKYTQLPTDGSEPYSLVDPLAHKEEFNFTQQAFDVEIHDIRGREADFTLDHDAFSVVRGVPPSAERDFVDDAAIEANYYPEVERLLLDQIPGSNKIYIFDHTVRRHNPDALRQPVQNVHIDQTAVSVEKRVRKYFEGKPAEGDSDESDEAERLLKGRYRIVNVWRPLGDGPVESFPLAFASSASVQDGDVFPVHRIYPDGYKGQTAAVHHRTHHKWNYLSGMTPDERLLIECFDSEALRPGTKVRGGRVPHTAFHDPRTLPDAKPRESIEVRALVFGP